MNQRKMRGRGRFFAFLAVLGMVVGMSSLTTSGPAQASGCVQPSKSTVYYHLHHNSLTATTYNSRKLCAAVRFNIARWSYDKPAVGMWPETFAVKDVAVIPAGGTTATATIPNGCGQVDAYKGWGPKPGDTLTAPGTPYVETFLSTVATGNRRYVRDKPADCATKVMGSVSFTEGSGQCVNGQWQLTQPSFTVGGDQDALADQTHGIHPGSFGQDLTVTFNGVAKPDTEILTGQLVWEHLFGQKPAWPASCYVHPKKAATGHLNQGCASGKHVVTYYANNTRSVDGTRGHLATATYHLRNGLHRWTVSILAGKKVVVKRTTRKGAIVSIGVYGQLLERARVTGSCGPTQPPHSGLKHAPGGKVVLGKA